MIKRGVEYRLDEVIGWTVDKADARPTDRPDRVLILAAREDRVTLVEACDGFFGVDLTPAELDLLIGWLTEARGMLS